ncbi:hypothetical protein MMC28_005664 [Mycoblastus sanguinarius]|nr:hypothetical protein [Mycoblastus sanguinarius]
MGIGRQKLIGQQVMVMEPMSVDSLKVRAGVEKGKLRNGLRGRNTGLLGKRKRDDGSPDDNVAGDMEVKTTADTDERTVKKKKTKGPKGPNPLSVKKPKKIIGEYKKGGEGIQQSKADPAGPTDELIDPEAAPPAVDIVEGAKDQTSAKRRKRKHKSKQLEILAAALNSSNGASE